MREFRSDGGREASKVDEFRADWKGLERDNSTSNMRTERKDGRDHRGGGEGRETLGGRRESRNSGGGSIGGDNISSSSARERKSDDVRLSSSIAQETGELREGWGSRTFLKSSSQAAAATATHGGEEGEIGEFTDDGGGGGGETTTRFEETKRKRDERGEPRGATNNSINNNATERDDRQREKSERRGGDLQVHIPLVPASQHLQREKEREEKAAEREKEKEFNSSKQKEKAKEKEESAVKEKVSSGNKESEVDSRREKESDGGYSNNRRKEAADQEEKDPNPTVEKRGGGPPPVADLERESAAAGTSAGGRNVQEENSKVGDTEGKERAVEVKEQQQHEKVKVEVGEEEKGKRKLRDYDRAGGDEVNNNAEGEDYEREIVSSYAIQRKRLLRPRGYQGSNTREVRPRFRIKDPESYPVRAVISTAENSTLVYRVGEGLQEELRRIRKEFEDRNGKLTAEQQSVQAAAATPTIEIRIPAELATSSNRQVQGSQLWGTDVYTDDSDLVAVLMHTGYYAPTPSPPAAISEVRATVRVLSPQERYNSTLRNSLRSRAWGAASGCAFGIDSCYLLKKDGGKIQLEPRLTFTPAFAPTLAPAVTERTVTTRAVSMNAYRAQRFVQEVTIQYNLCNEPWLKYSMNIVADKGLKKSQYTSARLKKNDVLYVETHFHRYELSYEDTKTAALNISETKAALEKGKEKTEMPDKGLEKGTEKGGQVQAGSSKEVVEKAGNNHHNGPVVGDKYRWALCKWPLPLQSMRAKGVPLSLEFVKVLENGLGWEEVQWSPAGVCVRGTEYPLARAHFVPLHD